MDFLAKLGFVLWALVVGVMAGAVGGMLFLQMPCTWFGQMQGNGCGWDWLGKAFIAGIATGTIVFIAYLTWYFRRRAA